MAVRSGATKSSTRAIISAAFLLLLLAPSCQVDLLPPLPSVTPGTWVQGDTYQPFDLGDGSEEQLGLAIESITPSVGSPLGGDKLVIRGSGFVKGANVTLGGEDGLDVFFHDDDKLTVTTPPHEAGPVDVVVTNPNGDEVTAADGFLFSVPFGIAAIEPTEGPETGGIPVTITGTGFLEGTVVLVGDRPLVLQSLVDDETILGVVPPGTPGTVDVLVSGPGGVVSLDDGFTYTPSELTPAGDELTITEVTPGQGPAEGGTALTIRGDGFSDEVEVYVGALPLVDVVVTDDGAIEGITPPGSPGLDDVRVVLHGTEAVLPEAFLYTVDEARILAVVPDYGAVAGGTYVRIVGVGLEAPELVSFGDGEAYDVVHHSPNLVTVRSPMADIGVVDVSFDGDLGASLAGAFAYFDPIDDNGGTWGAPIDGAVNVTVLDSSTYEGVEDAYVILATFQGDTIEGYTDYRGQVVLSEPWLTGPVSITASKAAYTTATIDTFDAENATVFLTNTTPSPADPTTEPSPFQPGWVTGSVYETGKLTSVPLATCEDRIPAGVLCQPCTVNADCVLEPGEGEVVTPGAPLSGICLDTVGPGPRCTTECLTDADCPDTYGCHLLTSGTNLCLPEAGQKQIHCFQSAYSVFSYLFKLNAASLVPNTMDYRVDSGKLGEIAVICMAGVMSYDTGDFEPQVMGVKRHVFVVSDSETPDQDVVLDIPLDGRVTVAFDGWVEPGKAPSERTLYVFLDLGSDGVIPFPILYKDTDVTSFDVWGVPGSLTGAIYDATYAFKGQINQPTASKVPYSTALRVGVGDITVGHLYTFGEAGVEEVLVETGLALHDLFVDADGVVWAVGDGGTVTRIVDGGFYGQPYATDERLSGIWGWADGSLVAVGDAGTVIVGTPPSWEVVEPPTYKDLKGIWGYGEGDGWIAGSYRLIRLEGLAPVEELKLGFDLEAISGSGPDDVWAVGAKGAALHYDGASWQPMDTGVEETLLDVDSAGPGAAWAVGRRGTAVLLGTGLTVPLAPPTSADLLGVWAIDAGEAYVVGTQGLVLHYLDGVWTTVADGVPDFDVEALAGADGTPTLAVGSHVVRLGPFAAIPTFVTPAEDESLAGFDLTWTYPDGAPALAFLNIVLTRSNGATVWSIMVDGTERSLVLPDLLALQGIDALPTGDLKLRFYAVHDPDFSIDDYNGYDLSYYDWVSWAYGYFDFYR